MREEYDKRNLYDAIALADAIIDEHSNCQSSDLARADDYFNLALIYDEMGKLEEAAGLYKESAMCICGCELRYVGGIPFIGLSEENWLALALRVNNLAAVFARMQCYEMANYHFLLAKAIYARFNHPNMNDILYNLGNLAAVTDNIKEAFSLHYDALELRHKDRNNYEDIMHSLHSLAFLYEKKGEYDKAISYGKTAMEFAAGVDSISSAIYLAELYEACDEPTKALELYEQALEDMETGYRRCDFLTILSRRAKLTGKTGDHKKALKLHNEVLDVYHSLTGLDLEDLDNMFYANCLKNMAELEISLGETANADELILQSFAARKPADDEFADDELADDI